ncbi:MAG TPA: hypothetical protein VJ831_14665 [Jatrophihabitantaceae bacterium]|nr:hypothetical protein [Jatrophihabitantaceae bacterium]
MTAAPIVRRIGWRGVAVELHAPEAVWTALAPHLPAFYDAEGEVVATGHASCEQDWLTVELPEQLSIFGALDDETCRAVSSRLELLVCTHVPDRIAVHAGVVAVRDRAIVLPGSSMAGKSTLVAALLELGATYFSDEFALLDDQGLVWPYPRPLTLRGADGRARSLPSDAADVGGPPVPLGLVADLHFSPEGWLVDEVSAAHGVLALLKNAPAAQRDPERAMACATAAVAHEPLVLEGARDDAAATAQRLLDAVDAAESG